MKTPFRLRRWLIVTALGFALYAAVGFFALPPIVKPQLERRLSVELGRAVTVERVRLNPFALSLTLENFNLREKDGRASFLGWNRLYVNFEALASLTGDWVLGQVELDGFHAAVAVKPDSSFNFADLLTRLNPPALANGAARAPAKPARPVRLHQLVVTQARVDFTDDSQARPFATVVGPLTFTLTEFRTAGEQGAPYHFAATTEAGEKLTWTGTLAADPVSSTGAFVVENLNLKKYTPYFEKKLRADVTAGTLTVRGRYEVNLDAKKRVLQLSDAELHVRDLHANERAGGAAVIELPSLDVTGVEADAVALKASISRVALAGGHVAVRREKDGSINLLGLLASSPPASAAGSSPPPAISAPGATPPPPVVPAKLPDVTIGEVALQDFKIDVNDLAASRPAQLTLGGLQVSVKNVTLTDGAVIPVAMSFNWAPRGIVQVQGDVKLRPTLAADLKIDVTGFEMLPLSPYLEQFINARVTQGVVSTSSNLHLETVGNPPAITLTGGVNVDRFGLVDGAHSEELAGFTTLALKGLKVVSGPGLAVSLDEVNVLGPYARVIVNADKTINLAAIAKAGGETPPPSPSSISASTPSPATTPAPAPKIAIGRVLLAGGDFSFADASVEPHLRIALSQFGGTISGLSSENLARGEVDLKGMVDGAGPVAIVGKLDPLGASKFVELKIDFKNVDLVPLSPYAGKFAGYELARGKLVVDTKFLLDGKKVESANVVTLHQFTFGSATSSAEATKLPVRLGVALLKDSEGKIVIDLPVQGTLDDPNFRVGKIVLRVVVNLLTKAATSPFGLIGSMFGGGGDELAFQEFAPGGSEPLPSEAPKLATLIKALTNRPALSLGLEGGYDAAADTYTLKQQKLADRVRRKIWEARHAVEPSIPPPEQISITPEENALMVKKLFAETFPPGTEFGAPLPPPPVVTAPPPSTAPKGFFKRMVDTVTFKERRERHDRETKAAPEPSITEPVKAPVTVTTAELPLAEMTGRLAEKIEVSDNDLRALANLRAQRVRDQLIAGGVAGDRLFLTQTKPAATENKGPRVFLTLQ